MPIALLFNHNVSAAVAQGLRLREVDVVTAHDDDSHRLDDHDLLQRSVVLGRALFSHDDDLLREAHLWQAAGRSCPGVIYVHQTQMSVGEQVRELERIARMDAQRLASQVQFLPLK
jgi:hypothetical protein